MLGLAFACFAAGLLIGAGLERQSWTDKADRPMLVEKMGELYRVRRVSDESNPTTHAPHEDQIDVDRTDCNDEKWRQARDRVERGMASDVFEALFMGRRPSRKSRPPVLIARDADCHSLFTPNWYGEDLTREELNDRIEGVTVPIEPAEWARRYTAALEKLAELRRRSPFPQLHFAVLDQADTLTAHLLENSLVDYVRERISDYAELDP